MSVKDSTIPAGFRQIAGFARYIIAEDGTILSRCRCGGWADIPWSEARRLVPWIRNDYQTVMLHGEGMSRKIHIHTLVLVSFVGPRPDGHECRHLDGNKTNNHVTNLRWGTHAENRHDKILHGTSNQGERHPLAKLTEANVLEIRRRAANGELHRILAVEFHVLRSSLSNIVRRISWKHI